MQVDAGEYVSAIISLPQFEPDHYLVMATRRGMIKKTSLAEYAKIRANGLDRDQPGRRRRAADGSGMSDGQNDIIVATQKGQAARFREPEVRADGPRHAAA